MSIKVQLIDKQENTIVYQGSAQIDYDNNAIQNILFKSPDHAYCWKVYDKGLVIESISEVSVYLSLRENHNTKGHIDSEFGRIDLQCWTSLYTMNENYIEVIYDLIQDTQKQRFHFVLNIYKEDVHAIH